MQQGNQLTHDAIILRLPSPVLVDGEWKILPSDRIKLKLEMELRAKIKIYKTKYYEYISHPCCLRKYGQVLLLGILIYNGIVSRNHLQFEKAFSEWKVATNECLEILEEKTNEGEYLKYCNKMKRCYDGFMATMEKLENMEWWL